MAIVTSFSKIDLEHDSPHKNVEATYSIVLGDNGEKNLQIDTYGSASRMFPGKKSQSIRFSSDAIRALKEILDKEF